ncbi:MAG: hypothetical protein TUN42_05700 [Dehalogenimonas sp.]
MKAPIDWLLEGEPWVEYATRRDLLGQDENDPGVRAAREAMLADPAVKNLVDGLSNWPGTVIASHKSANQPFHRLTFAADLGLVAGDPGIDSVISRILSHQSSEGLFALPMNISQNYGGSGREQWAWALCDAPLILYALTKFGLGNEQAIKSAVTYLTGLSRDNGWPCVVAKELGGFRGPGRKDDPCPYATLVMLKVMSQLDEFRDNHACHRGAESLLSLWTESRNRHPYMFYMGTDFRKLKAPFIWYDLLHVLDVLSRFPWLRDDPRLEEAISVLESKADPEGRFTVESVWTAWNNWEFGQKRVPSRWLTLLAWRVLNRFRE